MIQNPRTLPHEDRIEGAAVNRGPRQAVRALFFVFLMLSLFVLPSCSRDPGRTVFEKAENAFSQGEIDSALSQYQYIVNKYPESAYAPRSQYRVASIYNRYSRDKKKAMEAYATLYFMYPSSPETVDAREDLAGIYAGSNEHKLAIEQYQKLLTERPAGYDKFQYLIAMEYIMLNDFGQARVEFTELLGRASNDLAPQIQYQIANTYYIEGQLNDAVKWYELVVEKFPDAPAALDARLGIARSLSESGKLIEALALLKELKGKYPNRDSIGVMLDTVQNRIDEGPGSKIKNTAVNKEPLQD